MDHHQQNIQPLSSANSVDKVSNTLTNALESNDPFLVALEYL